MRSLRSRNIESTNSSGDNITDDTNHTQEQDTNSRKSKSKRMKQKRTKKKLQNNFEDKEPSNSSESNLPNFSHTFLTVNKQTEEHKLNVNSELQTSHEIKNMSKKKSRKDKRKKEVFKQSLITDTDSAPEFENVVTSTMMKPKKKRFAEAKIKLKRVSQTDQKENFLPNNSTSSTKSITPLKIKKKKEKRRQKNTSFTSSTSDEESTNNILKLASNETTELFQKKSNAVLDVAQNSEDTVSNEKKTCEEISFVRQNTEKEYSGLDDISDVVLDEIIDLSDSPEKSESQIVINISDTACNSTFIKPNETEKNGTVEDSIFNKSGEWQVQNLSTNTSNVKQESFKNDTTFLLTNENDNIQNMNNTYEHKSSDETFTCYENNVTLPINNGVISPKDKSIRKKWRKFAVNSMGANSVLEQINSPKPQKVLLSSRKSHANSVLDKISSPMPQKNLFSARKSVASSSLEKLNTPKPQKNLLSARKSITNSTRTSDITQHNLLRSSNKTNSVTKNDSVKKVSMKRTAMPNFALIHKRAYEKMESLQEYSERKKERAKMLLSSDKSINNRLSSKTTETKQATTSNAKENKKPTKISKQLFADNVTKKEFNRFGFKVQEMPAKKASPVVFGGPKTTSIPVLKPKIPVRQVERPVTVTHPVKSVKIDRTPLFERQDVKALANKNKNEDIAKNRGNRRNELKGVRTNRRFDLLMQMRLKEQS